MAGKTPFLDLAFFDFADQLDSGINIRHEINRFLTIDKQLFAVYQIFGDGVINGWEVFDNGYGANGISIGITEGFGIIRSLAIETTYPATLEGLPPNSILYVYVIAKGSSVSNRSASFLVSQSDTSSNGIKLAKITTSQNGILTIDNNNRQSISLIDSVNTLIDNHKHRGTPTKIDLTNEVKNKITEANIDVLDANILTSGYISPSLIPSLKHGDLENSGVLTHAQLDSLYTDITETNQTLFGEIATTNLIKLILFRKYISSDVDQYFINSFNYIPNITPQSFIDFENTTAHVDFITNTITGNQATSDPSYFFTSNITLPAKPIKGILTYEKNNVGTITFGVNANNSSDFDNYTVAEDGRLFTLPESAGNSIKIGIKFENLDPNYSFIDYPNYLDPYEVTPLFSNTIVFNFTNDTGSSHVYNFKVSFYEDADLTTLAYSTNTLVTSEGFTADGVSISIGGVSIGNNVTKEIVFDAANASLTCNQTYYIKIEYRIGAWTTFSDTEAFIKRCGNTFTDVIDFSFKNTYPTTKTGHFRIRFYTDNERTSLYKTVFSQNDQFGWSVNGDKNIPEGGYSINSEEEINVTYYPVLSDYNSNTVYYLTIDMWDGTSYISAVKDYTFIVASNPSYLDQYGNVPLVKNFGIMFELENNEKVMINNA